MGWRVYGSLSLSTILYMHQPHATQLQKIPFALLPLHLITLKGTFCCTASRRVVGVCRWTSELPLRGSFSKRSTGRWVNRSTGQQVDGSTGHFFGHYIVYDSRRHDADQSKTTPLQKSTQRLLLARRVIFPSKINERWKKTTSLGNMVSNITRLHASYVQTAQEDFEFTERWNGRRLLLKFRKNLSSSNWHMAQNVIL